MARKVHTRTKRRFGLTTRSGHKRFFLSLPKKKGARTFKTQEQANQYAKEKGITNYTLVPAKKGKKFKIEAE